MVPVGLPMSNCIPLSHCGACMELPVDADEVCSQDDVKLPLPPRLRMPSVDTSPPLTERTLGSNSTCQESPEPPRWSDLILEEEEEKALLAAEAQRIPSL